MPTFFRSFVIILSISPCCWNCVATSPGTGVTTTTTSAPGVTTTSTSAPGVTTTTDPTATTSTTPASTTTGVLDCTSCTLDMIEFLPADQMEANSIESDYRENDPEPVTGCLSIVAVCTAEDGMSSFMQFNNNQGGPLENEAMTQVTEANIQCVDGVWRYNGERDVFVVQCYTAPMGG